VFSNYLRTALRNLRRHKGYSLVNIFGLAIAWPVAWYAAGLWLDGFAYRVDRGWPVFLLAGLVALAAAVVTVGFQAVRAAIADPAKTLRYE